MVKLSLRGARIITALAGDMKVEPIPAFLPQVVELLGRPAGALLHGPRGIMTTFANTTSAIGSLTELDVGEQTQ